MENTILLITAMAEQCRSLILESGPADLGLPKALQPKHLLWMCKQIEEHANNGPATKLHRWIGFVQGAMLANRMVDLDGLKAMFDQAKAAHADTNAEFDDMTDHLDPTNDFEFDIGGES